MVSPSTVTSSNGCTIGLEVGERAGARLPASSGQGCVFFPSRNKRVYVMRPVRRSGVNKGGSAKQFRGNVGRTNGINMRNAPMRGGFRL